MQADMTPEERPAEHDGPDDPLNEAEGGAEEDLTPEDAPAEPARDPESSAEEAEAEARPSERKAPDTAAAESPVPRTTTTGDPDQDLRTAGDGALSGVPGDDLDDYAQRHD
jgi:hypothetical protein